MKSQYCFRRLARRAGGTACWLALWAVGSFVPTRAADWISENVRSTPWRSPAEEQKTFHLPPGFEIQLVAAEPDLFKPMNMAFDEKGRLWVTVTREYPFPVPLDKTGRDAIKILEDTDGDGRADKITTFVDGLNIPIGLYPYRGGCIAWSIPNIWYFQDTDGDGKADKREVLYGPFDYSRDTHGNQASFRRGFDGWLYATHGYNNDSRVKGSDGHEVHMNSGNTYRLRLDGSRIEQHTWGQVNPFGLVLDPLGNLYSSDCHSAPIYQLLAGGYYPSFGKPDDGLGFAPTMMEKPRGSTALCGISYYADDLWPEEFRDSTFMGDVMVSCVLRDRLVEHGATKMARARPDFVTTDDPWFRPVDTQLGPDGALYIADFYNRIIGHYEVPLNHPGRDRTSGRIWRVVYRGGDGQLQVRPRRDLSQATIAELINALGDANLTFRLLAMNQLSDRFGPSAVPLIKNLLQQGNARPLQKIHGLWLLQRLGALEESLLTAAAQDADRAVRTHALRIMADTAQLSPALQQQMRAGLNDPDALVERCAAEAMSRHPAYENVAVLLALRHRVPTDDTHLLYSARKALRDQLNDEATFNRLTAARLSEADAKALADVAPGVTSAAAGSFLLAYAQKYAPDRETLAQYLRHAARYAPESALTTLAQFARAKFANDPDFQLALLKSVQQGLDQRGAPLSPDLREWGAELAAKLLDAADDSLLAWGNTPLEGSASSANPWFLQRRASADGDKNSLFLCSLPPGGESLTGVLRSGPFTIPAQLTFWLAGHDGYPDKPAQKKNCIRLRRADTLEVCAETFPPRNDTAQKVSWDLNSHLGQQGFVEITDGDTGAAFAWLAVGRFDPPVAPLPKLSPNIVSQRQQAAAELAAKLRLSSLEPALTRILANRSSDAEARAAIAGALVMMDPKNRFAALAPFLKDASVPVGLRDRVGLALTEEKADAARGALVEALRTASQRTQIKLAQALAGNAEGCETLLEAVAEGKVSPRLLLDRTVKDKLLAARPQDGAARWEQLTKGLPPANAQLQKIVEEHREAYKPAKALPVEGARLFTQYCAVCHSIEGQGGNVAPQLDGIGARGLDRLCEDVIDPNRNVDRAFRTTVLTLKDGDIASGLFRRQEGELVVLADSTGKEISIPQKQIAERRESESSLMPENFGELLSQDDFNHLMAFLLSQGSQRVK